jgi:hypothetical protein
MNALNFKQQLPYISTPREARFLSNVINDALAIKELRTLTGSDNIWDTARHLRAKGWLIHTIKRPVFDRDGNKTTSGYYQLDQSQREHAQTVLNEFYRSTQQTVEVV